MPRATPILRQGRKALEDLNLLKVLQSEISHENSNPFQGDKVGSLGDFTLDWDSSKSQDVVLRRKCESGEEVAVSALLGAETFAGEGKFPREVLMKVCVKKPGLSSLLQFDCGVSENGAHGPKFNVYNACYLHSSICPNSSAYRGPLFSTLDPALQTALKEYLVARGIGGSLTKFLLFYLHEKEQGQYVNWLQELESLLGKAG
ncbi:hypothetical protein SLE2022_135800 [Rubroshorea leprosula]